MKSIGRDCFYQCTSLTDIVSLERATSIGESAFNGCTALDIAELYIPNLATIGYNAFNGVKVQKINGFGKLTSVVMKDTSESRWGSKTYLTEVVLNDELVTIGSYAFSGYSKITSIHPQGSIKTFDLGNVTNISNDAFINCTGLTETPDLTKITYLGDRAFEGCNNVDFGDLILPNLTGIGVQAFNCSKGPRRILNLGTITRLIANNGTNSNGTFVDNSNLTLAILPSTLTTMGTSWQPFIRCTKLSVMILLAETPPSLGSKFSLGYQVSSSLKIYVPDNSVEAYKSATNWSGHARIIFPIDQLLEDNPELYAEIKEYLVGYISKLVILPTSRVVYYPNLKLTTYYNGTEVTPEYLIEETDVVTIAEDGTITFLKEGSVTVIVNYNDESVSVTYTYAGPRPPEIIEGYYVNTKGQLISASGVIACKNLYVGDVKNITWGTNIGTLDRLCSYDNELNFINSYEGNKMTSQSITLADNASYVTFDVTASSIQSAYVKNTNTGKYIWKGINIT